MSHRNRFALRNDWSKTLILNVEPESTFFSLKPGEEVSVTDIFTDHPVTLKLSHSDAGDPILSIWPGDGDVRIEKNGVDILDMLSSDQWTEPRNVG